MKLVLSNKSKKDMASTSDNQRIIAQKTWELSNNILEIAPGEEIYKYDRQQQQQMLAAKPWEKDHHFFKDIKVCNNDLVLV